MAQDPTQENSMRTMREDLKKGQGGNRAPRGKEQLDKIVERADSESRPILQDLRPKQQPSLAEPKPSALVSRQGDGRTLDDLLPIEEKGEEKTPRRGGGSPPPNLPGLPQKEDEDTRETPPRPAPTPKSTPAPRVEPPPQKSEVGEEPPEETPEELLGIGEKPPEPPEITPFRPSSAPQSRNPWKFIGALAAIAGGVFLLGFLVWGLFIRGGEAPPPPPPTSSEPPQEQVIEAPSAGFATDSETIVRNTQELRAISTRGMPKQSIIYAPFYIEDTASFATPEELFAQMDMRAPAPFFRLINEAVSPYMYVPDDEDEGPRLGIVFHVAPENRELVRGVMEDWERTMAQDLRPLVLGNPSLPPTEFQSAEYRGVAIRYINLPASTTAIDYALHDRFVVIATSKNSLQQMLDRIIVETP